MKPTSETEATNKTAEPIIEIKEKTRVKITKTRSFLCTSPTDFNKYSETAPRTIGVINAIAITEIQNEILSELMLTDENRALLKYRQIARASINVSATIDKIKAVFKLLFIFNVLMSQVLIVSIVS